MYPYAEKSKITWNKARLAAVEGDVDTVQLWIDQDPLNVITPYIGGYTLLHLSSRHGQIEISELLLYPFNFQIDVRDIDGNTPFHEAAKSENLKMVQLLIERGASINIKNRKGKTPLDLAKDGGNSDIYAFIKSALAKEFNELKDALQA